MHRGGELPYQRQGPLQETALLACEQGRGPTRPQGWHQPASRGLGQTPQRSLAWQRDGPPPSTTARGDTRGIDVVDADTGTVRASLKVKREDVSIAGSGDASKETRVPCRNNTAGRTNSVDAVKVTNERGRKELALVEVKHESLLSWIARTWGLTAETSALTTSHLTGSPKPRRFQDSIRKFIVCINRITAS